MITIIHYFIFISSSGDRDRVYYLYIHYCYYY